MNIGNEIASLAESRIVRTLVKDTGSEGVARVKELIAQAGKYVADEHHFQAAATYVRAGQAAPDVQSALWTANVANARTDNAMLSVGKRINNRLYGAAANLNAERAASLAKTTGEAIGVGEFAQSRSLDYAARVAAYTAKKRAGTPAEHEAAERFAARFSQPLESAWQKLRGVFKSESATPVFDTDITGGY